MMKPNMMLFQKSIVRALRLLGCDGLGKWLQSSLNGKLFRNFAGNASI
jgi:hypothetical protein